MIGIRIASVFAVVVVWYLLTRDQTATEALLFPSPVVSLQKFLSHHELFISYTLSTWQRVIVGCLIGAVSGIGIGFSVHRFKVLEAIVDPLIEIIRPVPPIALTPFFILWFGLGNLGQYLIVALGCFMVVFVGVVVSVRNVAPVYIKAARSLGAGDGKLYLHVLLPAVVPSLLASLRVSAATGFGLTVAAEYLGAQGGLGFLIRNARTTLDTDTILVAVVLLGAVALMTDLILRLTFRAFTDWQPRQATV